MKHVLKLTVLSCVALAGAAAASPLVFVTDDELAAARARVEDSAWARAVRDGLAAQADALAAAPLEIPRKGGQWTHWYSCSDDGARLKAKSPTEHVCTLCGKVYSGSPYDEVYITGIHSKWLRGLEPLGWAYALEPKPEYAKRARDILLEYASFYETLPLHDVHNKKGSAKARLYAQTLDEAVTLCRIAVGYALMRDDACFSDEDRATIESGLIRPMCATIQANDRGISNWQTWHNAGVGCAGYVLGDAALVDWALNGKSGLHFQLEHSVLPTGLWYEESVGYHWYSLRALVYLLEAAARAGEDVYGEPVVKKLFDAPVRQLRPNLTFPAFHDSDSSSILSQRGLYETAYKRFRDPVYTALIQERDTPEALFWGVDDVPDPQPLRLESSSGKGEGLAVLRDPSGRTALYLDYGPGQAGHNHPAKLGIVLWAHGDERLVDPGRLPYGNPMHAEWFRQTVAHNTVLVNEQSQRRTPGRLTAFGAGEDYALVRAACDTAYKDSPVKLDRTVFMRGGMIVDVFRCAGPEGSVFDLPLHFRGKVENLPAGEPVKPISEARGYRVMKNVRRLAQPLREFDVVTGEDSRIGVRVFDSSEAYTAEGPSSTPGEIIPLVLRRQNGDRALFVTVYDLAPARERECEVELGETVTARVGDAVVAVTASGTRLEIDGKEVALDLIGKAAKSAETT